MTQYADALASFVFVGAVTDDGRWRATLFTKIPVREELTDKQMRWMRGVIEQYYNEIWITPADQRQEIYSVQLPGETFELPDRKSDVLIQRLAACWSADVISERWLGEAFVLQVHWQRGWTIGRVTVH